MTIKPPFGKAMREAHFQFAPSFTPLNHGSYGASPRQIQDAQTAFQTQAHERPDPFIVFDLPDLIDSSRIAIAPLLGVHVDEVVFVPNATTGVNTVLRNLKWEEGDVVVHFSTIYGACEKTLSSISELTPLKCVSILLEYPVSDSAIRARFRETVRRERGEGRHVKLAMFDTVLTFPGARMPWEGLVGECRELGVLSLIDGAHGIGHIDLRHLGSAEGGPDFFVSNCHKWLYTPRACAVFHVPFRNQHLIRTCLPTSHGYQYPGLEPDIPSGKSPFVHLFEFVATFDYSPYLCVPAALEFREKICGGEEKVREYCFELARAGGQRCAEILGTSVIESGAEGTSMNQCCFSNVKLPLHFTTDGEAGERNNLRIEDADKIQQWLRITAVKEFDTYLQIAFHAGSMWVRLSGQIYLDIGDFEWVGHKLKELCHRVERGEVGR